MAQTRVTQRKPRGAYVLGLLAGGAALLQTSTLRSFASPAIGVPPRGTGLAAQLVGESAPALRSDGWRGDLEPPRTVMQGERDPGKKNGQGGKRNAMRVNRKPVLAYSKNDEEMKEPGGSVLRRMWDMYDMDFERMAAERARYWRVEVQKKKWTADYKMKQGRRRKERRKLRNLEEEWQQWMRTSGRQLGWTDPVVYNGPVLKMTPEEEENFDPTKGGLNPFKQMSTPMGKISWKQAWGDMEDMKPGRWNFDGTAELMFKIWRRPLHKHPFDIPNKGKGGKIKRGNVF